MQGERRKAERMSFYMNECRGLFVVTASDDDYEIDEINDISLTGIGLGLPVYLDQESEVNVAYEEEQIHVSIKGRVAWCEDHPEIHGTFRVGIQFDYSDNDESSQLLMAVDQYTGVLGIESS